MIILTGREIKDLAEFSGLTLTSRFAPSDDELETEYVITECPKEGVTDDDGVAKHYDHIAYLSEYPEEGVMPLGESKWTPTAVRKTTLYKSIAPWLAPKDRKEFARMLGMVPRSSMTYSWCDGFSTRKLFDAFAWVLTPQGADYWEKLNDNLEQAGYYNAN